jgi:predicted DNA-binding protein (MmcQ/YjbR family)
MARKKLPSDAVLMELRTYGLTFPGSHTKSPWPGHLDLAVKDKTFAYLSLEGEPLHVSCKLPESSAVALMLPFVKPAAYGLGKSGWVAADLSGEKELPVEMLKAWLEESYRAQAPKKLVAQLDGGGVAVAEKVEKAKKQPAKRGGKRR